VRFDVQIDVTTPGFQFKQTIPERQSRLFGYALKVEFSK
jgi:hypothetical protein